MQNKTYVELWTATLQRWGDGSDDLALPIPLEVQRQLGLTENSVVNVEIVDERLVVSHIRATEPSNDGAKRS
jgi:antitoxin component of MazEF toxin-antitoxin module